MLRRLFIFLFLSIIFCGCKKEEEQKNFCLEGAWSLVKLQYPDLDSAFIYPNNGITVLRIYETNGNFYQGQWTVSNSGNIIAPDYVSLYKLVNKGNNEFLYFEDDSPYPLNKINDSTITIQHHGRVYTWKRENSFSQSRLQQIEEIIKENSYLESHGKYVFSKAEVELKSENNILKYSVTVIVLLLLALFMYLRRTYKKKKDLEQLLEQINRERENRPQIVSNALKSVEQDFLHSDYYLELYKRINTGKTLSKEEWQKIEEQLNKVYPDFTYKLQRLYKMSAIEYQVSLLLKLRIAPSEMANVLCKDVSTISSVRSRLYSKVFSKKGSAKQWDEFILSL